MSLRSLNKGEGEMKETMWEGKDRDSASIVVCLITGSLLIEEEGHKIIKGKNNPCRYCYLLSLASSFFFFSACGPREEEQQKRTKSCANWESKKTKQKNKPALCLVFTFSLRCLFHSQLHLTLSQFFSASDPRMKTNVSALVEKKLSAPVDMVSHVQK